MPSRHVLRLFSLTALLLFVCGCQFIGPQDINTAEVRFVRKADGTPASPQKEVTLGQSQSQIVQGWLNAHRNGWFSRYDVTTLPDWCLHINANRENPASLCRYGERVVLRGFGPEVQHSLTESDKSFFAQHVEALNG